MTITLWYKNLPADTLGSATAAEKIVFGNSDHVAVDLYSWPKYDTNIKLSSNDNRIGVRNVTDEDAGFNGVNLMLKGHIGVAETQEVTNLFNFIKLLQVTEDLPGGRFSIKTTNFLAMDIEADSVSGICIQPTTIVANFTNKSYDFEMPLVWAGQVFSPP